MKNLFARADGARPSRNGLMAALSIVSLIGLASGPALADDRHDRDREIHRDREVHRGPPPRFHEEYRAYDNGGGYVYAPPAVIYAPAPPAGIDFVFPIEIR